jgi:hypothetical protein
MQEVRLHPCLTEPADNCTHISYEKGIAKRLLEITFFAHNETRSAVKRAGVIRVGKDVVYKAKWSLVFDVQPPTDDKSEDTKDSFDDKLQRVFYRLTLYHTVA